MKSLAPNTLLQNRYLVVHLIGKGGMGDVYLAVDQRLGSAVALKRTFFADDEMLGNAFEREAKTLARLRHPVLPKVSDHFTEGGEQYLVMEHISGEDLSKRLESANKPFPFSWVLFWADQLLDALGYLHSHEPPIIHRDIKPQNLKLTDENHIILLDFGLSKNNIGETKAGVSGRTGGSTAGSSIVGYTPHYAPMEQIRGTGTNPRSDIYSLSATIYQLLTNVVPADALSRADSMLNDLPDPITPINEINPEVSPAVSRVIIKGMEVSQEKRFSTAREMQKILRDAYAQMQNSMAAQTMAFNLQEAQKTDSTPPAGQAASNQEKTEVLNFAPAENNSAPPANNAPIAQNTGDFSSANPKAAAPEPNFDATLKMEPPPVLQTGNSHSSGADARQSDVKTEVFLAEDLASAIPQTPSFVAPIGDVKPAENFTATENFAETTNFGQPESKQKFAPNATVPLFQLDDESSKTAADAGFYANSEASRGSGENFEDFSATRNLTDGEIFSDHDSAKEKPAVLPPPVKPVVPVKKSSPGKTLGMIAGLGALLLVLIGGAGGGWWYYKNHQAVIETPTPTPLPTATLTPIPTPTTEETPDTNQNAAINTNRNSNANSSESGLNSNSGGINDNAVEVKTKTPTPTPTQMVSETPKPTSVIKPTAVKPTQAPIKPPVKPPVKPTVKPTILQ